MAGRDIIAPIPLRFRAGALLNNNLTQVGTPLPEACVMLILTNQTNQLLFISFDGVTDHEVLLAGEVKPLFAQMNNQPQNYRALWPLNTRIFVRSPGGVGTGALYISGYYQPTQ